MAASASANIANAASTAVVKRGCATEAENVSLEWSHWFDRCFEHGVHNSLYQRCDRHGISFGPRGKRVDM